VTWTADTSISCRAPQGVGAAVTAQTLVASQGGLSVQTASYFSPTISRITPQVLSTFANTPITIQGRNFGYFDASAVVTIGLSLCSPTVYMSDSSIRCTVQSGAGSALNVSVLIATQIAMVFRAFSYSPPQINDAIPRFQNTTGGVLTVLGQNFGFQGMDQRIFVGSTVCSSASSSPWISGEFAHVLFTCVRNTNDYFSPDSSMSCIVSQGVGNNLNIVAIVAQQQAVLVGMFSYLAPIIGVALPLNGRPGDYFTVIGRNFGAPAYSTPQVFIGSTGCPVLNFGPWNSPFGDSLVVCSTPAGAGVNRSVFISFAGQGALYRLRFNYFGPAINLVGPLLISPAGNTTVSVVGTGFGASLDFRQGRIGGTAAPVAAWISDSSLTLLSPGGIGTASYVTITIEEQEQSLQTNFSYRPPAIVDVLSTGVTALGNSSITIVGSSFGSYDNTAAGQVTSYGGTGTAFTASYWTSDSSVLASIAAGTGIDLSVCVTIATLIGVIDRELSYDAPVTETSIPSNIAPTGRAILTLSGYNYGASRYSSRSKIGDSVCMADRWSSDTSLQIKSSAGSGMFKILISIQNAVGTSQLQVSYNRPFIFALPFTNMPAVGLVKLTLTGSSFGVTDMSLLTGFGGTLSPASSWRSDTTLVALVGSGIASNINVVVGVKSVPGTCFSCLSFDKPTSVQVDKSNSPTSGSRATVLGASFGSAGYTGSAAMRGTSCEFTSWLADSSIPCKIASGLWQLQRVVFTVGFAAGTSSQISSYDLPTSSGIQEVNYPSTGGNSTMSLFGKNFGSYSSSVNVMIDGTISPFTTWLSDSCILSKMLPGVPGPSDIKIFSALANVSAVCGILTQILSYNFPLLSNFTPSALRTDISSSATISGKNFALVDYCLRVAIGSSLSVASFWTSDTSLFVFSAAGISRSQILVMSIVDGVYGAGVPAKTASFSSPRLISLVANTPTLSRKMVNSSGIGFGAARYSISFSTGSSVTTRSEWISDTSAMCRISSGIGIMAKTICTVGVSAGTSIASTSFDVEIMSSIQRGNYPTTSNLSLSTLLGSGMSSLDPTLYLAISGTKLAATTWKSDSSVMGKVCPGVGNNLHASVMFDGRAATLTSLISFDRPVISSLNLQNGPKSSAVALIIAGSGYGSASYTQRAYVGQICRISTWVSDTLIVCTPMVQIGTYFLDAAVVVGGQVVTWYNAFSYNMVQVSAIVASNARIGSASAVSVIAANIDTGDTSPKTRFGSTGAEFTIWISTSTVLSRSATSSGSTVRFALTANIYASTITNVFTFDSTSISHLVIKNQGTLVGTQVVLKGMDGINLATLPSARTRIGSSASAQTLWVSATTVHSNPILGTGGSLFASVTAGLSRVGTVTTSFTYDMPSSFSTTASNLALFSITSINVGSAWPYRFSATARLGSTRSLTTSWLSQSSVIGKMQQGSRSSQSLLITAGLAVGSQTRVVSYDGASLSTVGPSNIAASGRVSVSVRGAGFAGWRESGRSRAGATSSEGTAWTSDSGALCKAAAGHGASLRMMITSGGKAGTASQSSSYDRMLASGNVTPGNAPTTGSVSMYIRASGLGWAAYSCESRLGGSACESSLWGSDTTLQIRTPSGVSQNLVLVYTTVARVSTGLFSSSYDVPVLQEVPNGLDGYVQNQANGPCTGGSIVTLWGQRFGNSDFTSSISVGSFMCSISGWTADTSLYCRSPSGAGVSLHLSVTVGREDAQLTRVFSFDSPQINSVIPPYTAASGGGTIFLSGSNFGAMGVVPLDVTIGATNCRSVLIISDNTIRCVTPPGVGEGLVVSILRSGSAFASVELFSYRPPTIGSIANNFGSIVGGNLLLVSGSDFGTFDSSILSRVGSSASSATFWTSDTSFIGRVSSGTGAAKLVVGTVGMQETTAATLFSYKQPFVSSLGLVNFCPAKSAMFTLQGVDFGNILMTGQARQSDTSAASSLWTSDTTLSAKSITSIGKSIRISVTISCLINVNLVPASFDSAAISQIQAGNVASNLKSEFKTSGSSLAVFDNTIRSRVLGTACEMTRWSSDTLVSCKYAPGTSSSLGFEVTIRSDVSYLSQVLTFDEVSLVSPTVGNGATFSSSLSLSVGSFSRYTPYIVTDSNSVGTYSGTVRIGSTTSAATIWVSGSTVRCLHPSGFRATAVAILTLSSSVQSLSESFSYNRGSISVLSSGNQALDTPSVARLHSIFALNVGQRSFSGCAKYGVTNSESTQWTSESTLTILTSVGLGSSFAISITAGCRGGSNTRIASYDSDGLSRLTPNGNAIQRVSAVLYSDMGIIGRASSTLRFGSSACEFTFWASLSSLVCKVPRGIRQSLPFFVTIGTRVCSFSKAVSYTSPVISTYTSVAQNLSMYNITLFGNSFALTSSISMGVSVCRATVWTSDTSLSLGTDRMMLRTIQVLLTAGQRSGSISDFLSFQPLQVKAISTNGASAMGLITLGINLMISQRPNHSTVRIQLGSTSSESTIWTSYSSISCKISSRPVSRYTSIFSA
jgi:hypothetical protein